MKVFVVGANGGIGRRVSACLAEKDNMEPVAMIRDEDQGSYFDDLGIQTAIGDLEDPIDDLKGLMSDSDAVVFTAGSGGETGFDKTLLIDLDAAVKCMEAAQESNIERFLMVSAIHAGDREAWSSSSIKPYMVAKHYADRFLMHTDLAYTIVRPGGLTNEKGLGTISTTPEQASTRKIPRDDVAEVLTESLENDQSRGKIIECVSGNTPISEAVASL